MMEEYFILEIDYAGVAEVLEWCKTLNEAKKAYEKYVMHPADGSEYYLCKVIER